MGKKCNVWYDTSMTKSFRSITPGTIGFGALAASSLVSLFAASQNKAEALMEPFGPLALVTLTLLVAAGPMLKQHGKTYLSWILYTVGAAIGLIIIYQGLGMGKRIPLPDTATLLAILGIILSILLDDFRRSPHAYQRSAKYLFAILMSAGFALTAWLFLPRIGSTMLPPAAGTRVAIRTVTAARTAFFGTGAENFVTAFTTDRPQWLAETPLWNMRFSTNANFFLHMTTTYGLLGLAASFVLARGLLTRIAPKDAFRWAKLLSIAALLFIPPTGILLTLIALVFVLSEAPYYAYTPLRLRPGPRIVGTFVLLALGTLIFFLVGRAIYGELLYRRARDAALQHDGTKAYNLLGNALKANPYATRYHMVYSQINIALANSLARELAAPEQDQKLISSLIDQGIREAKIAVNLNTRNVMAWENLSSVYQSLIRVADGADAWAVASYGQTIELDPNNPLLLLNLGAVYVHQKKYDDAIMTFKRAANIRPSYANVYYNLANVYRLQGNTVQAAEALEKTMSLVPPGSSDYHKVKNELNATRNEPAQLPPTEWVQESSELTLPQ